MKLVTRVSDVGWDRGSEQHDCFVYDDTANLALRITWLLFILLRSKRLPYSFVFSHKLKTKLNAVVLVRKRTIPTE
jgi:hypothetical protein